MSGKYSKINGICYLSQQILTNLIIVYGISNEYNIQFHIVFYTQKEDEIALFLPFTSYYSVTAPAKTLEIVNSSPSPK
jgi:hypothetical protein